MLRLAPTTKNHPVQTSAVPRLGNPALKQQGLVESILFEKTEVQLITMFKVIMLYIEYILLMRCVNTTSLSKESENWRPYIILASREHKWQPTPLFLPGESQGRGSLVGCRLWGRTESDTTEVT